MSKSTETEHVLDALLPLVLINIVNNVVYYIVLVIILKRNFLYCYYSYNGDE